MSTCVEIKEKLSAVLDGEASAKEAAAVEEHLENCRHCAGIRDGLARARGVLAGTFEEMVAGAPPPPERVREDRIHRLRKWVPALAGVAAVVLVVIGVTVISTRPVDASPQVLLHRAAVKYLALEDAELWVTVESKALQKLAKLLGGGDAEIRSEVMKILVKAPNLILLQESGAPDAPWDAREGFAGFDGKRAWFWNEDEGAVEIISRGELEKALGLESVAAGASEEDGDLNLLEFLSLDFVRILTEDDESFRIREVTGPTDRRVGRRVLKLKRAIPLEGGDLDGAVLARARVTIDPSQDLIEKIEPDLVVSGLNLVTIVVEVAEGNQGIPTSFFSYEAHLAPDVTVIDHPENEEKK